jgi:hypothetical protein
MPTSPGMAWCRPDGFPWPAGVGTARINSAMARKSLFFMFDPYMEANKKSPAVATPPGCGFTYSRSNQNGLTATRVF